jgi:hypothetical protein
VNTARLPDFSRRNVQHVERNSDALALVLLADLLERCRLQRAVNRDQIMLVVHFDAVSCRDLDQLACKEGHAENDRLGKVTPTLPLNPAKEHWVGWWIKVTGLPLMYWNYMLKGHVWFPKHNTAFKGDVV